MKILSIIPTVFFGISILSPITNGFAFNAFAEEPLVVESVIDVIKMDTTEFRIIETMENVYFVRFGEESIDVFDEKKDLIFKSQVEGANTLSEMAVSESKKQFFITIPRNNRINIIDMSSGEINDTIRDSGRIALNDKTSKLYVEMANNLNVYDVSGEKPFYAGTIKVTHLQIFPLVIDDRTNQAYVVSVSNIMTIIDLEKNEIMEKIYPAYADKMIQSKFSNALYLLDIDKTLSMMDMNTQTIVKKINVGTYASYMAFSEKNERLYVLAKNKFLIFDSNLNELAKIILSDEMWFKDMAVNQKTNRGYVKVSDVILVLDLDCKCPSMQEADAEQLFQRKIQENSGHIAELAAQRIVRGFESYSLSISEFSNEDGKILLDYFEEFFLKHKDKFDPEIISSVPWTDYQHSEEILDSLLDSAALKDEFYEGYAVKFKEIFKTKLQNIDTLHDQSLIQLRDLEMEESKKEYYVRELNKKKETMKNFITTLAASTIQPFEEKAASAEYEKSLKEELEGSGGSLGGGCLIATATYGSELAPQVQQLRELRDDTLLQTNSGSAFMTGFNQFYYSFSPTIADWERQNPVFKEAIKLTITPLLATLSILNYVDIDSEEKMLGYGIGVILLNVGMYIVAPAAIIWKLKRRSRS